MHETTAWKGLLFVSVFLLGAVTCRGQGCTSENIRRCLQPLEGANIHLSHGWLLQVTQWNATILREACNSTVPGSRECAVRHQDMCGQYSFFGGMFYSLMGIYINFLDHMCDEATLTDVSNHGKCLNKPEVQEGVDKCYLHLMNLIIITRDRGERTLDDLISLDLIKTISWFGFDYFCGILSDIRLCNARNVDRHCGPHSVYLVDKVFKASIKSVATHVRCNFSGSLGKCLPNPCMNNGQCNFTDSGQLNCTCPPGFEGERCERPTTCFPNPCLNRGLCNVTSDGIVCICQPGYDGHLCNNTQELPDGPCIPINPCLNGGRCENTTTGGFNCSCPPGYHGKFCENEGTGTGLCLPNPCEQGGLCEVTVDRQFTCKCPDRYAGDRCQISKGCRELMCENNGTCHDDGLMTTCLCPDGYTGRLCDVIIVSTTARITTVNPKKDCSNVTCLNGGTCRSDGLTSSCSCPGGFGGDLCEIKVEPGGNTAPPDNGWSAALAIAVIFGIFGALLLLAMMVTLIVYRRRKVNSTTAPSEAPSEVTSRGSVKKLSAFTWRLKKPSDVINRDV